MKGNKSIIQKWIQKNYISGKDYAFINEEVKLENRIKGEKVILKEKGWFSMNIKKMLMNLLKL